MKIVFSANNYWNLYNFRFNLIREFCKKHDVYLLAEKDKYYKKFSQLNCKCKFINIDPRSKSLLKNFMIILNFYRILKQINPEYFFSFTIKPNIYGGIFSKFLRFRSILTITGLGSSLINKNFLSVVIIYLYKISIKFSYKVFFHNSMDRIFFIKNNIFHKSYKTIPGSGIDLKKFKPKFKKINQSIKFLMISRLINEKGFFEFLEAANKIKDNSIYSKYAKFTLVSFGKNYLDIKTRIALKKLKKNHKINFVHNIKDIISIIRKSDCLVNPSYREGLSRSILEAMSQCKPILASNVPGCNNLVKNRYNGLLFRPRSSKSLFNAIKKFIDLSALKKRKMQIQSIKFVQNFDENKVINLYINALNE